MNAGGPPDGNGNGNGNGGGGNGNQITSTSVASTTAAADNFITSTSTPLSSVLSSAATSTSTSSSTSSSNIDTAPIIGGVVGGIALLLLLSVILVVWLQGRNKKKMDARRDKRTTAERMTYTGLNSRFAGVPFTPSPNREHHDSLIPAPLFSPSKSSNQYSHSHSPSISGMGTRGGGISPYSAAGMSGEISPYSMQHSDRHGGGVSPYAFPAEGHGGEPSPYLHPDRIYRGEISPYGERTPGLETDRFLPTSPLPVSAPPTAPLPATPRANRDTYDHSDIDIYNPSDIISPMSAHHPTRTPSNALSHSHSTISQSNTHSQPRSSAAHSYTSAITPSSPTDITFSPPPGISVPTFLNTPQRTRDTMGFPVDVSFDIANLSPSKETPTPINVQPPSSFRPNSLIPRPPPLSASALKPQTQNQGRNLQQAPTSYREIPLASPRPSLRPTQQSSLEQLVRGSMGTGVLTPEPSLHRSPSTVSSNPRIKELAADDFVRESPVLGDKHPVRMQPERAASWMLRSPGLGPSPASNLTRNLSQKTTASSIMPPMVSDAELERLGVGVRRI